MNPMLYDQRRLPIRLFILLWILDVAVFMSEKAAVAGSTFDVPAVFYIRLLHQPWWWVGLAMGPLQLWVWTAILRRVALSVAYPVSSANYLLTMAAARLVFGEQLGWSVWLGAVFITAGIVLVGSSATMHRTGSATSLAG